jgi:hypothetical protein
MNFHKPLFDYIILIVSSFYIFRKHKLEKTKVKSSGENGNDETFKADRNTVWKMHLYNSKQSFRGMMSY